MAQCNYCNLQDIKKAASKVEGARVIVTPRPEEGCFPDGVDIYIHYPKDPIPTLAGWLAKLPDHCVCHE